MLKIDSIKNFSPQTGNRSKAESSTNQNANSVNDGAEDSNVDSSDFARVLENLSKESKSDKQTADKPKESNKHVDSRVKSDDKSVDKNHRDGRDGDNKNGSSNQDAIGAANARVMMQEANGVEAEQSVPPARAILHVADLERIVSSFRTQLVDGNQQVVITLKNSVFNGLQIKLTADGNRRITAEFVAANEKIKTQIDSRANELTDLMRRRGVQIDKLQTSVDAGTSDRNQDQQQAETFAKPLAPYTSIQNDVLAIEDESHAKEEGQFEKSSYRA